MPGAGFLLLVQAFKRSNKHNHISRYTSTGRRYILFNVQVLPGFQPVVAEGSWQRRVFAAGDAERCAAIRRASLHIMPASASADRRRASDTASASAVAVHPHQGSALPALYS
jgi:hypothetical protein